MALTKGQQLCVDTLDRPLVVAAGAGSGKTFTLTKRIVGALQNGHVSDIDEVLAITFTTKAAAELKSRIKAELRACGLMDQALRADEAWVSTIHGMCARILRAHAIELGLDPMFAVAEGAQVAAYLAQAVDDVLVEAQAEGSPALDALFAEYPARSSSGFGVSVEGMLTDLVYEASSHAGGADSFVLPEAAQSPAKAVSQAARVVADVLAEAALQKEGAKRDEWIASTEQLVVQAREALEAGALTHGQALALIAPFKLAKTFGSKEYKAQVDEARGVLGSCVMEVRLGAAHAHLETLVGLARRVLDSFSKMKRADGVLDNNDLLVLASRAIEEHPAIAARYADKFKLVMVDEFQDTDQMQVDMIKRLAGEGACRLCTVGDAQQSIYRFRGADVSVYRRHVASVSQDWTDSVIRLSDNFRSHPDVLAFVDRVFEKPDMFGAEFMSLRAGRDESEVPVPFSDSAPRIVVQHTTRPWRGVESALVIEVAAGRIADEFASLRGAGHAPGEMVVLLGRMTHAAVYAQALRDRGLPCVVSGGSVFADTIEANVALELTRVIANPLETQSLFNVLTSPLFALTAADLLAAGGPKGFWHYVQEMRNRELDASAQLSCAARVLNWVCDSIGRVPVARIIERVLVDSGWLSRMQSEGAEGLAAAANMFKAVRLIRAIEKLGALGAASVARRFADELAHSKEAPGALSVSGGDSVRIMTVHASKGLEFPIVAVAEFKDDRAPSSKLLASSVAGNVYLSLDLGRSLEAAGDTVDASVMDQMRESILGPDADEDELARAIVGDSAALHRRLALREYAAAGDREEAKRLLYVALTRAKEALVVSTTGVRTKADPWGMPKNSLAGVLGALDSAGAGFQAGRALCDFGGSMPALLECVALEPADADAPGAPGVPGVEGFGPDSHAGAGASKPGRPSFMVPAPNEAPAFAYEPYKPLHQGVFSYSSISDASHEGDLLDYLADAYFVSADDGADEGGFEASGPDPFAPMGPYASFDDDFWDFDLSRAFDEDRATDLGTAFHRLAQFALVARGGTGPLSMPPAERIEALSRTCNLDGGQLARLNEALGRWFASEVAHDMASLSDLAPEVPFFVKVPLPGEAEDAYLEGEIDLLGFDDSHERATVVDYKTGGRCDEGIGDLRRKHVLQASCYAYAIMLQGVREVDAIFVRVERPCASDASQPQCVRYHFTAADIPALAQAIARIYLIR